MKELSITSTILLLIGYTLMGYATSKYASYKEKNPKTWFLLGFLFGVFAMLALFIIPKKSIAPPRKTPSPFDGSIWYYLDETNSRIGPVSFEKLKESHAVKKLPDDPYIWGEAMPDWKRLSSHKELHQALTE
jgi:hypothetical protein